MDPARGDPAAMNTFEAWVGGMVCHVTVQVHVDGSSGQSAFLATPFVVDAGRHALCPLATDQTPQVRIPGATEQDALSAARRFLEALFGPLESELAPADHLSLLVVDRARRIAFDVQGA
jgi:hypothetical protein